MLFYGEARQPRYEKKGRELGRVRKTGEAYLKRSMLHSQWCKESWRMDCTLSARYTRYNLCDWNRFMHIDRSNIFSHTRYSARVRNSFFCRVKTCNSHPMAVYVHYLMCGMDG